MDWRFRLRVLFARILIRLGKLTHADYTEQEINDLITPFFPQAFNIDVPVGKGTLTLLQGEINMHRNQDYAEVQLFGGLLIASLANPIYRAHLVIRLHANPTYDKAKKQVRLAKLSVEDIRLVEDEYALLKDSHEILSLVVPKSIQGLVTGTMKSAFGLLTAGGSDLATSYLNLYLSGSKQRILDYHKPQVASLVSELADHEETHYQLDENDWQEYLFAQCGEQVVIEDGFLRFKF